MILIQGYKRKKESIVGEIKCFGLYEIDLGLIDDQLIPNTRIEFANDIFVITETRNFQDLNEIGIYNENYIFYDLMPNYFSGNGVRNEDGRQIEIMFDPNFLQPSISKFVEHYKELLGMMDSISKDFSLENNELDNLKGFESILGRIIKMEGIVRIFAG